MSKKTPTKSKPRGARQKKSVPFWAVMVGIVAALGIGYAFLSGEPTAYVPVAYAEEDVANDKPIHAIHEMKGGPVIPFLPEDQPQPEISFAESFYDFGAVWPTAVLKHKFIVRNTGEAPLTISRAYTTCGCTTADISARVIPPGKLAVISVRFDAGFHDTRGQTVSRGVIIENNDRGNSKAEVWVKASVNNG
jgi:hypothetical protein